MNDKLGIDEDLLVNKIWRFPYIGGYPQKIIPFEIGIFHEINHPAILVSPFMETAICLCSRAKFSANFGNFMRRYELSTFRRSQNLIQSEDGTKNRKLPHHLGISSKKTYISTGNRWVCRSV